MIDLAKAQAVLAEEGLDGWLLYDFRGQNPLARDAMLAPGGHYTRRWFCLIPRAGEPRWLVHAIERVSFAGVRGEVRTYAHRRALVDGLADLVRGLGRVAMEYSPENDIPYVSRVDAGTLELVRKIAPQMVVASSGDLVQRLLAPWPTGGLAAHERAARALEAATRAAWNEIAAGLAAGRPRTECEVQAGILAAMERAGLITDHPANVSIGGHGADPHFSPSPADDRPIGPGEVVLIDLWAREPGPEGVFADMTFMAFTGAEPPAEVERVWQAVRGAREAALALVLGRAAAGEPVMGCEVDRASRAVIERAGYGERFVHRTGHSLGPETHWVGANMDDYETCDTRRLTPGTGFTIEPGIYLPGLFGVRSEIDVFWDERGPRATTERQERLVCITAAGVRV